jgi:protein involved in polysaccharide export with SLBB domain
MALNFQLGRHGFMKQIRILKMGALTALVMASALGLGGAAWAQLSQEDAASAGLSSMGSFKGVDTTKGLDATRLGTPSIRQIDVGRSAQMQPEAAPVRALPLVPNDFQKFVQDATGQNLPLFGAEFFRQSGAFASSQSTPVTSDYRIGAGDEVLIRGWGSVDIDVRTAVDRNGLIFIPRVGSVPVAGLQSSQLEPTIRAAIARYYRDFQLSVTQGQIRGITVYMVGQARQPGAYTLPGTSTLVSALFATGGPNNLGSMRHIQVKRGSQVVTELDLYDFIAKGDKRADVRLQDGDTILIPAAAGFVGLIGKVSSPAVYELANEQETIGQLLAVAGGLLVVADPKKAYLERMDPSRKPSRSVESFALDAAGMNKPMKRGDLLTVQALTTEFGNAVTLRGNVSQPARMPWREGMRVRDLIPNKAVLMSKESVSRQNGVLLKDNENEATLASRIGNLVEEVNLEYAVIERVNASDVTVKLLPFNLGAALEDDNGQDNLPLQPGDVITVFSVSDVRVPQAKRQVYVRVEGEVRRPGVYQMSPGEGLDKLVDKAGGLTDQAYLFGAAFYREEVRRAQVANLDQLTRRLEAQLQSKLSSSVASAATSVDSAAGAQVRLQAESAAQKQALERMRSLKPTGRIMLGLNDDTDKPGVLPTLALESQDRLLVPPKPDFVSVLGSVNTESSMLFRSGSTVGDYLERAGLTSGADLDEIFVLRADGSVISDAGSWFGRVKRSKVLPGDVIVLPEKVDHESAWSVFTRNAKDITQIVYQFSLGAAAIKSLRQ